MKTKLLITDYSLLITKLPMMFYKETPNSIILNIYIQPKASQNKIIGEYKNCLKIQLTQPPIKGAANKACINFLAKEIKIPKSNIKIIKGETAKQKQILIQKTEKIQSFLKNLKNINHKSKILNHKSKIINPRAASSVG